MHDKSLSSVKVFNEILAVEQGKTVEPDESVSFDVKQESYELELTEDPDFKVFSEEMKHTPHSTYAEHRCDAIIFFFTFQLFHNHFGEITAMQETNQN